MKRFEPRNVSEKRFETFDETFRVQNAAFTDRQPSRSTSPTVATGVENPMSPGSAPRSAPPTTVIQVTPSSRPDSRKDDRISTSVGNNKRFIKKIMLSIRLRT